MHNPILEAIYSLQALTGKPTEKHGNVGEQLVNTLQEMHATALRREALKDVGNLALAMTGVGVGARGAVGLYNLFKRNLNKPRKPRSGPAQLALPYPVEVGEEPIAVAKNAGFFETVTSKTNIPWYTPAMTMGSLAGLGLGWKGVDLILKRRAAAERQKQIDAVREQFHEALMFQHDDPTLDKKKKVATDTSEVGMALHRLCETFEKAANLADTLGGAVGLYGTYAGLTSLLTGAIVYDKMRKRQRRALLEKALQLRERKKFERSPTEIMAMPEPVQRRRAPSPQQEAALLNTVPEDVITKVP